MNLTASPAISQRLKVQVCQGFLGTEPCWSPPHEGTHQIWKTSALLLLLEAGELLPLLSIFQNFELFTRERFVVVRKILVCAGKICCSPEDFGVMPLLDRQYVPSFLFFVPILSSFFKVFFQLGVSERARSRSLIPPSLAFLRGKLPL